jgi:hypothetical protein
MKKLFFKNSNSVFPATQKKLPSLAVCLVMDFLGYATYAIPVLGEFFDVIWAPISALIFMRMFGGTRGFFGGIFNFVEEILPGLDFIPTFTITWFIQYFSRKKEPFTIRTLTANHIH